MNLELGNTENQKTKKKNFYEKEIQITNRDIQIFRFLLDMKFASREAIAEKFFWSKSQKSEFGSLFRTRDRLYKLQLNGWIMPIQYPGSAKNYFQATPKAFRAVKKLYPDDVIPNPIGTPDFRSFEHDLAVLNARMLLERKLEIWSWMSDKLLRTALGDLRSRHADFNIPDGIYLTPDAEKVAFEFERTQKSKTDYRIKIRNLIQSIRKPVGLFDFQKVHFVCQTNAIFEFLKNETKIYGDLFWIQTKENFFAPTKLI